MTTRTDIERMQSAHDMLTEAINRAKMLRYTLAPVVRDHVTTELGAIIELMRDSRGECSND